MNPRMVALTGTGQVSGAERVLVRALVAATEAGWQVSCLAPPGRMTEELAGAGVAHVPVPELAPSGLGTAARWMAAAGSLRAEAARADLVLVNSLNALPAARLARCRAPVVWLAHDVLLRGDRLRAFRWCRPALAHVVAVSEAVAAQLGNRQPVTVVHNGVPIPSSHVRSAAPGALVVGLNAVLTPWKGHEVLLDAAAHLEPGVRFELMGGTLAADAGYAERLRERVARTEELLPGRVRLLGHVPDPQRRMRSWSVAVSASVEPEACPLSVLEAMSLGIPVVATDHGGAPEVLAGTGLLVPPGDPVALAGAVARLLSDVELWDRCREAGLARVRAAHRLDQQLEELLSVLWHVARARPTGSRALMGVRP